MTTKDGKQWWDPYETSYQKQFVYWPNSSAESLLYPTSTSFIDSYSRSGPFGSTVNNMDLCLKPVCEADCIHTGTAAGQRRNDPHPSQLTWRLPRKAAQSSEYTGHLWKCNPFEDKICEALTAQYRSIYTCDFMSMHQGYDYVNNAERRLKTKHSKNRVAATTDTEMRDNYRKPKQKPELLPYNYNTDCKVACLGIVPTVVHIHTQKKRLDSTHCSRIYGKTFTNKEAVKIDLGKDPYSNNKEEATKRPEVINNCSPEWISSWPGPI